MRLVLQNRSGRFTWVCARLQASVVASALLLCSMLLGLPECIAQDSQRRASVQVASGFRVLENKRTVSLMVGNDLALSYNKTPPPVPESIEPIYARSGFLHPVNTPTGETLTDVYPVDHAHQDGIFNAWVNTTYDGEKVDFWNIAGGSGLVAHERVVETFADESQAGFSVGLLHRATRQAGDSGARVENVDVLRERWTVSLTAAKTDYYCFDIESSQEALTDKPLTVNEYHYGGMAFRGRSDWLLRKQTKDDAKESQVQMLNSRGSDRIKGNHERVDWIMLSGPTDSGAAAIVVMSHPTNFRTPQPARLHPTKPYFVFSPCVEGEFTIDREHPLNAKYRYFVLSDIPSADWLDQQFRAWK